MHDMYEAPPDLFVAGLAGGSKGVAVFSFARYDPRDSKIGYILDFGKIVLSHNFKLTLRQNYLDHLYQVLLHIHPQAKLPAFLPTLKVHQ